MKVVIMAGGKGSRIAGLYSDIPKPMIEICGVPILEREINILKNQGFTDIIITVNHLGEIIKDYFGNGHSFGVKISYYTEQEPLGNAGALYEIRKELTEDFLLINADTLFNIDLKKFYLFHKQNKALVTILTHPNTHPYDSGIIICNDRKQVLKWYSPDDVRPVWYKNRVNGGIHILSPSVLDKRPNSGKVDLDKQILKPLAGSGKLFCYDSSEYIKDMGTPERLAEVESDLKSGIVFHKVLSKKQKAIFLDRDGTINKYIGFLKNIDDFEILPHVVEAIKLINRSGFLAIVITNQPVVARGEVSLDGLELIHNKMETLLGNSGCYLDGIYFCPHHPDSGYVGEIASLKIDCNCRKPKAGLFFKAADDFNIDLSKSWMIGDSDNDVIAGKTAGCKTMKIKEGELYNAVKQIIQNR